MKLSPKHSMWLDFIMGAIGSAGFAMFFHHLTYYTGPAWHWAFADHGLYGIIMLVASVAILIWRHKPRRGSKN